MTVGATVEAVVSVKNVSGGHGSLHEGARVSQVPDLTSDPNLQHPERHGTMVAYHM